MSDRIALVVGGVEDEADATGLLDYLKRKFGRAGVLDFNHCKDDAEGGWCVVSESLSSRRKIGASARTQHNLAAHAWLDARRSASMPLMVTEDGPADTGAIVQVSMLAPALVEFATWYAQQQAAYNAHTTGDCPCSTQSECSGLMVAAYLGEVDA